MTTTLGLTLSSAHGVINWVLGNSTVVWATVKPTASTCLSDHHVLMVWVTNRTD